MFKIHYIIPCLIFDEQGNYIHYIEHIKFSQLLF